jgi:signal transduction histidine kinase/CheY-like chemotaxis protein
MRKSASGRQQGRATVAWMVLASVIAASALASEPDDAPRALAGGRFVLGATQLPTLADGRAISLPHAWEQTDPEAKGDAWYVLPWTLGAPPAAIQALYLSALTVPTQVYVNGELVGATGPLDAAPPRSYERSRLIVLPSDIPRAGVNTVALHVRAPSAGMAGLGPVFAGNAHALRERALFDLATHTLGPAAISVATFVIGLLIAGLWLRRRDPSYGLFGCAAMLWAVHTAIGLLPETPLPEPHWDIAWHTIYLLFVVLLCLFCVNFAGFEWRLYRRVIVTYAAAVPAVLYLASAARVLEETGTLVRLGGIVIVFAAFAAVARYAWRRRDAESFMLFLTGGLSAAFAVHDWLAARDPIALRPVWLVPYAALFFLTLVGYILIDRFVLALNRSERINVDLEQRVAEKSAALAEQLATTQAAKDAAEAADRAKSHFLAAASHDLRQPLHALGMFSQALAERTQDSEGRVLVQRIANSVSALETLFSALLDVSKLDAGAVVAHPIDMPVRPLLDRLADEFAPEALERGLKLSMVSRDAVVRSDPMLLERILRNLVANALRYTERGGVVIGCRRRKGEFALEIWDSGPGIPVEERERIFEEFYQIPGPHTEGSVGLGLGLAIVRRLAHLLGHRIELASREGRGSMFRVIVPPGDRSALQQAVPSALPSTLVGRRVAVLDDDPEVCDGTVRVLSQWGCEARAGGTVADVRRAFDHGHSPDAMIVDFRLSDGVDGIAAIAELQQAFGPVPAVLVSGESTASELARIQACGVPLLHKPVAPARLRSVLTHLLSGASAARELK